MDRSARRSGGRMFALGWALAAVAGWTSSPVASATSTTPEADSRLDVIAQSVVEFGVDDVSWSLSLLAVDAASGPIEATAPSFVVGSGASAVLLEGSDAVRVLLDPGEAVFRPTGATSDVRALGSEPGQLVTIAVGPVTADAVGDGFAPGAGPHDVELLLGTLAAGEVIAPGGDLPVLVYIIAGDVSVGGSSSLTAGASVVGTGDIDVRADGDTGARILVARISPLVDLETATTGAGDDGEGSTTSAAASVPATTATPPPTATAPSATTPATTAPPSTTAATTSVPPPTEPPTTPPDSDGDGLGDSDEAAYGTNPGAFDTDGDGLGDGDEVFVYGTNPTDPDTDDNGTIDPG